MKKVISTSGLSYSMEFIPLGDAALLEIITVNHRATEKIERPTLIDQAKEAYAERDFSVYETIFKTLGNRDIAAMGI